MEQIVGIGVDHVEIDRVLAACERKRFLEKYFSEDEQELIEKRKGCAATNFAGKEAVAKAFGTGFIGVHPREIQILRHESGAPYVKLTGRAKKLSGELGITRIHISLSDSRTTAVAYVIASSE